jgi:phosphoenolpyruvate---glycerone phosphotransferase subunit DhaK
MPAGSDGVVARNGPTSATTFINDPADVVAEMLEGFLQTHARRLRRLEGARVVVTTPPSAGKVAVITGGGSGHEPALLGYVGPGLMDAVVVGDLFASPPAADVLEAIRATDTGRGAIVLLGNYAGDVLNFEMAAEWARDEGRHVEIQLITDDVGAGTPQDLGTRRGLAGGFLVWKAAGAAAARGGSLDEVRLIARHANEQARTVAVAARACTIPGSAHPSFDVSQNTVEFGVGHGEPGIRREPARPVDLLVDDMVEHLVGSEPPLHEGDRVVTLVNGLGGTLLLELYIGQRRLARTLAMLGIGVHRSYVGPFYTALDTAGFSITLLNVDAELAALIDAPAEAPHFAQLGDQAR